MYKGSPTVVKPNSIKEAAHVITICHQQQHTLLIAGNSSQMGLGNLPQHPIDVLLQTTALNRFLEHEAADLTCHVEAGMTLQTLQTQLAIKGQQLALDVPNADQHTIGGILATNASGSKRLKYGTARDLVIGLRVIQANGDIARSGGKVVKNVAGYDLNKLYIGSLGTLGAIVEVNFKVHPLPDNEQSLLFSHPTIDTLMHLVMKIIRTPLTPVALSLSGEIRQDSHTQPFLAIRFEGHSTLITRQIDEVHKLAQAIGITNSETLDESTHQAYWEKIGTRTQGNLTCKVSLLVSYIAEYLHFTEHLSHRYNLDTSFVAYAGNGILYVKLDTREEPQRLVTAITELRARAQELKGNLVIERCPTELKQHIDIWGTPRADFLLMQKLKQHFDPQGTFVGGRFLGGL